MNKEITQERLREFAEFHDWLSLGQNWYLTPSGNIVNISKSISASDNKPAIKIDLASKIEVREESVYWKAI